MKNLIIAWRNLWRNSRRTLITVSSVFFGVILSTVMSSMQEGSYSAMVDNVVKFYSGYIQVQEKDYWENKTINESYIPDDTLLSLIDHLPIITHYTPRLENFALAAAGEYTKGARVMGVDPEGENRITGLTRWIEQGKFLEKDKEGLVLGYELAKNLGLSVNDTLILLGQGFHGINAAGKFPVRGIIRFPNPDLNRDLVYMDLATCQKFYGAEDRLTSLVLMVRDHYDMPEAMSRLKKNSDPVYRVMSWDEMQPAIVQLIEADRSGGVVMKAILYLIIAFGILGTILMMMSERKREMGVMVAIGMQKLRLGNILFLETLLIGIVGTLAGFIGSLPIIAYFYHHPFQFTGQAAETFIQMGIEPLLYFSWQSKVFTHQVLTVFLLTLCISFVPYYRSLTLRVYQSLKS
jgi:ABC-type lipoprotein release transport system permease subunit